MNTVDRVRKELANRRLVVVAGTGVTASLTRGASTSTWLGLIRNGITHVEKRDRSGAALLELRLDQATSADDLTGIAHDLKRALNGDFGRWIGQAIGELKPGNDAVSQALGALGAPILTTNYDDLIEQSLSRGSTSWHHPGEMRRVLLGESTSIGHLHGVWRDLDTVIFSQGDYQRITEDPNAQALQTSAFSMYTFLFVGVGDGLSDPNFSPMLQEFSDRFPTSPHPHYRLCLDSQVDPSTELGTVVDVGYGTSHQDLPEFLRSLTPAPLSAAEAELGPRSRTLLLDTLRDNSTLWRDAETLNEKTIADLVVAPIFLPEPHDQYATAAVLNADKDKPEPIDLSQRIEDGGIIIIAGEESSGVSTALAYSLNRAMDVRSNAHALLVSDPMVSGARPIGRVVDRTYRDWGLSEPSPEVRARMALAVDNLRFDESSRFERAINDIVESSAEMKIIGVRQHDAVEIGNVLKERTGSEVYIVYLGRFSHDEARELARRVAPGKEVKVAHHVMIVIREKNLPRTPFTITLLVDLVQSGVRLQKQESESAVLDQYLDLLLNADLPRTRDEQVMTLRNKRLVLELLARQLVKDKKDEAPESDIQDWLSKQFDELGWDYNVSQCINDLVSRRVLTRSVDNCLRFQRSAYLELMAGIAARDDAEFRALVFEAPLQLASIVRTYAAMTRNATDVLELVEREIERIAIGTPSGGVFASVRKIEAKKDLFTAVAESDPEDGVEDKPASDSSVERKGLTGKYYDDSDDSDSPAFLTARIEDLSLARVAMLVVDLSSRVLRDSDEVRDQKLKERILRKLLHAWVAFTDLHEAELSSLPDLDELVADFLQEDERTPEEVDKLKHFLVRLLPSVLTASALRYFLSGPSLVTRLIEIDFSGEKNGGFAQLMRTIALHQSGTRRWVETLKDIDDDTIKVFFSASFLASVVRYSYLTDIKLTDGDRDEIRKFLRRVVTARYSFTGVSHKSNVLSNFETRLQRERLDRLRTGNSTAIGA